jgi:hypothetical protein
VDQVLFPEKTVARPEGRARWCHSHLNVWWVSG